MDYAFIDFLEGFLALIHVKSSVYNLSRSDRSNKKLFTLSQKRNLFQKEIFVLILSGVIYKYPSSKAAVAVAMRAN